MIHKNAFTALLILCLSCSPLHRHKTAQGNYVASTPMACKIEGLVVSETTVPGDDTTSLCAKYPCRARVKINRVLGCGSSVSVSLNEQDTVTINFAYTLHNTKSLFPAIKKQYPGLKVGQRFTGDAIQHQQAGTDGAFTIYDYDVLK